MLKILFKKISDLFLGFWVFIYILLEELIWDTIARPVFEFLHDLKILQRIESSVVKLDRYVLLGLFLFLFIQVEAFGIVAIGLIAKGQMAVGIGLYAGKIPIAAFTFWLFRIAKDTLMTFGWFKWSYDLLMLTIDKIKSSPIHQRIVARIILLKEILSKLLPRNWAQMIRNSAGYKQLNQYRLTLIERIRALK